MVFVYHTYVSSSSEVFHLTFQEVRRLVCMQPPPPRRPSLNNKEAAVNREANSHQFSYLCGTEKPLSIRLK